MCTLVPIVFAIIYLFCGIMNFYYWQWRFSGCNKTSINSKRWIRIIIRLSWILFWPIWLAVTILINVFYSLEDLFEEIIE